MIQPNIIRDEEIRPHFRPVSSARTATAGGAAACLGTVTTLSLE
jgi:hypothetical protein